MPRILPKLESMNTIGACMLLYGPTGCGKTDACITGIDRILHMNKEPKDARLVHADRDPNYSERIDYIEFDGFYDEIDYLNELIEQYTNGKRPYETIFHDGLTFSMHRYNQQIEDDRFAFKQQSEKKVKKGSDENLPSLLERFNK